MKTTTRAFRCGHSFEPENQVRIGGTRVGCKTCRNQRHRERIAAVTGQPVQPQRADPDARLRRFD